MKLYHSISEFTATKPTVLTIGTFDGFHIGHQKIINRVITVAKQKQLASLVLTFFPHPRMVVQTDSDIKLIHTIDERVAILANTELDYLIIQPFTKEFSRLTAEEFVRDILVAQLKVKHIIIGYDHRFGKNRTATITDLKKFGKQYDFTVEEITVQEVKEVSVSSTKVRKALQNGDIETVNTYLGTPFCLTGTVVRGKGNGRKLNFPTANVDVQEAYKLIPKNGVYIAKANVLGKEYLGMMNIGVNPTLNGEKQTIEIHLFNFNADIYNQKIKITVLKRIRDEQKFESLTALKHQLENDKQTALAYFNS